MQLSKEKKYCFREGTITYNMALLFSTFWRITSIKNTFVQEEWNAVYLKSRHGILENIYVFDLNDRNKFADDMITFGVFKMTCITWNAGLIFFSLMRAGNVNHKWN